MSLRLPPSGHPTRELFEVKQLAEAEQQRFRNLPTFRDAVRAGRDFLKRDKAARSVHSLCLRADGELWLIRVGNRGGFDKVWNFGNPFGGA